MFSKYFRTCCWSSRIRGPHPLGFGPVPVLGLLGTGPYTFTWKQRAPRVLYCSSSCPFLVAVGGQCGARFRTLKGSIFLCFVLYKLYGKCTKCSLHGNVQQHDALHCCTLPCDLALCTALKEAVVSFVPFGDRHFTIPITSVTTHHTGQWRKGYPCG